MAPMSLCCMIDSWPISPKLGVGVVKVTLRKAASNTGSCHAVACAATVESAFRIHLSGLVLGKRTQFVVGQELNLVMPMPCSPETPSRLRASTMMRAYTTSVKALAASRSRRC
jgi:hypothetical protein